jgi:hygromycin-B 7''-O-kinase
VLLPDIRTWAEWGSMFTAVQQWAPALREICRRESIDCCHIEPGYPGTNAVFILDHELVVKIYAPFCHRDYALERQLYPLLERKPRIPAPRLIAHGVFCDRIRWPYIVMDFKPGVPIREARSQIGTRNRVELACELGEIVRELHQLPLDEVRGLDASSEGWARLVQARETNWAAEQRQQGVLRAAVIDEGLEWLDALRGELEGPPLALLNGDLTEDHLLVERRGDTWRVSALIDFGDTLVGRPEYEWIALWFGALDREAGCMTAFMERYDPCAQIDAEFLRRAMAFTVLHQFGAGIVATVLQQLGNPPVRSFSELQQVLWGDLASGA